MTTKEEIVSMKKDISSINEKMDNLDSKLDAATKEFLADPMRNNLTENSIENLFQRVLLAKLMQ